MNRRNLQTRTRVGLIAFCIAGWCASLASNAHASRPADILKVVVDSVAQLSSFDANSERVIRVVGSVAQLREVSVKRALYLDGKLLEVADAAASAVQSADSASQGRTLAAARVRAKARLADGYYVEDIQVRAKLDNGRTARARQLLYYLVKGGAATQISIKEYSEAMAPATTATDAQGNRRTVRDAATTNAAAPSGPTSIAERIDG